MEEAEPLATGRDGTGLRWMLGKGLPAPGTAALRVGGPGRQKP